MASRPIGSRLIPPSGAAALSRSRVVRPVAIKYSAKADVMIVPQVWPAPPLDATMCIGPTGWNALKDNMSIGRKSRVNSPLFGRALRAAKANITPLL
ncbi:MAG: hypothetical protein AMXMBFR83_22920 [Phycisphaerae bacterium]